MVNNFNCRGFGPLLEDKLCLIFKLAPSVCRMTFPILASLLVRLVVLLPFQLLRLSLATPSRWTPLALSVFLHREISMKDVFRSGDSSKKFKIAEGQWYRYAPSYVSPAYHLLEGFPFIQEPPSGDLQERVLIRHHDYDQCFQ